MPGRPPNEVNLPKVIFRKDFISVLRDPAQVRELLAREARGADLDEHSVVSVPGAGAGAAFGGGNCQLKRGAPPQYCSWITFSTRRASGRLIMLNIDGAGTVLRERAPSFFGPDSLTRLSVRPSIRLLSCNLWPGSRCTSGRVFGFVNERSRVIYRSRLSMRDAHF